METYTLVLERESSLYAAAAKIAVSINGGPEDRLSSGNSRTYEIEYKPTNIRFVMRDMGITFADQIINVDPTGYSEMRVQFKPKFRPGITSVFSTGNAINYTITPGRRRDVAARPTAEPQGVFSSAPNASNAQNGARRGDFCTQCGTKNPPDANFCSHCGNKL